MKIQKELFLGKKAEDLSRLIDKQSTLLFKELNIDVPVKSSSIILSLLECKQLSVIEIADNLNQSRQVIIQKLPKLKKLKLLKQLEDINDKRRKIYILTAKGLDQAKIIIRIQNRVINIYQKLYDEIESNLIQGLNDAIYSLESNDLLQRYKAQN